jgi:hypothetical protein
MADESREATSAPITRQTAPIAWHFLGCRITRNQHEPMSYDQRMLASRPRGPHTSISVTHVVS